MPAYYPVYLNLTGKRCVVFGGGAVAEGKIPHLLEAGARVTIVSPKVTPAIQEAARRGELEWQSREYQPSDLEGAFLSIAATSMRQVNQQISEKAARLGVLVNVVDDPSHCAFIAPSVVKRGPVTLAISTGGTSPALARKLRELLANDPVLEWADLAGVLARARAEVKKRQVEVDRQRWQCCMTPQALRLAQAGQEDQALALLLSHLLDGATPGLCSQVDLCNPAGCHSRPQEQPR
jgi:precorrin-2 dehydrogenase/sirohydrochlorin ferrochelatase